MTNFYQATQQRLDDALPLADDTRAIVIGDGTLSQAAKLFRQCFGEHQAVLVADRNSYTAAGKILETQWRESEGLLLETTFVFPDNALRADREHADMLLARLAQSNAIPIAVGSGTVNDLTKLASYECKRPYMAVATAASMDGYTAFGASVKVNESKQTLYCPAPTAVLVDMDVIVAAQPEMGAFGYADLIAKLPAGADWMLADHIGIEPLDSDVWSLVQEHLHEWLANPTGIAQRDRQALALLMEGLLMSGLGMQKAKSSRAASGSEHLFSHLWDNQDHTCRGKTISHGAKVGIGTIAISALYERIVVLSKDDLLASKQTIADWKWTWPKIEAKVRQHFGDGGLARQMLDNCRQKYAEPEETLRRIDVFADHWDDFRERLKRQNLPATVVQQMIRQCGAPATPEEIGISRERLLLSFEQSLLVRSRYTVLDFVHETGLWDRLIPTLFAPDGFFSL